MAPLAAVVAVHYVGVISYIRDIRFLRRRACHAASPVAKANAEGMQVFDGSILDAKSRCRKRKEALVAVPLWSTMSPGSFLGLEGRCI